MAKDEERDFRLRPRKPPARNERAAWASAYKIIMHHGRTTSRRLQPSAGKGSGPSRIRPYSQRCAVRVIYAKNATSGQWALRCAGKRHAGRRFEGGWIRWKWRVD